jgi:aspartate aminotransferase-like enzyme
MFPKSGFESPTVNCVNSPSQIDGLEIYERMRGEGFELAKGYGAVQNLTFRIGNMGYIETADIDSMLQALGKVLVELGWKH